MASLWTKFTDIFSRNKSGVVPQAPSGTGTSKYLREDGTWAVPSGGGGGGGIEIKTKVLDVTFPDSKLYDYPIEGVDRILSITPIYTAEYYIATANNSKTIVPTIGTEEDGTTRSIAFCCANRLPANVTVKYRIWYTETTE